MNCKQGDLAVIVKSDAGNEGKIVRCIRLAGAHIWSSPDGRKALSPTWETDIETPCWKGVADRFIADDQLRPIRPQPDDAQDETLAWLPVPATEREAA